MGTTTQQPRGLPRLQGSIGPPLRKARPKGPSATSQGYRRSHAALLFLDLAGAPGRASWVSLHRATPLDRFPPIAVQPANFGTQDPQPQAQNRSKTRFARTVSPTLRATLISTQNRHPPGTRIISTRFLSQRSPLPAATGHERGRVLVRIPAPFDPKDCRPDPSRPGDTWSRISPARG